MSETLTLSALNELSVGDAEAAFLRVCNSRAWAAAMVGARPYGSLESLHSYANLFWWELERIDWLEAFSGHPRIGSKDALRARFATTAKWASGEQQRVSTASEETIQALLDLNEEHERKYGYIFIVCATGKSAEEMLAILSASLANDEANELRRSAGEENKITHIRLEKLLTP